MQSLSVSSAQNKEITSSKDNSLLWSDNHDECDLHEDEYEHEYMNKNRIFNLMEHAYHCKIHQKEALVQRGKKEESQ